MKPISKSTASAVALLLVGLPAAAGSLDPPGAPAPTMKPLDLVDPGTPITSLPAVLDQSGLYYLTRSFNTQTPSGAAIQISASGVTLDLRGFRLTCFGCSGNAIDTGNGDGILIRNGSIKGFYSGIVGANATVESMEIRDTISYGIQLVASNIHRTSVEAAGGAGIFCDVRCTVSEASVRYSGQGIFAGFGTAIVTNSVVAENSNGFGGGAGIVLGPNSVVRGSQVLHNESDGIVVGDRCLVTGNLVRGNLGHGIRVDSSGENRIEDNHLVSNSGFGIWINVGGNFVVRNSGRSNTMGFLTTNGVTPNVAPVEIGTATNPWANIEF